MNKKWAWFGMGFFSGFIFCIILIAMLGHNASKNDNQISDEASSEVVEEKSKIVEIDVPDPEGVYLFDEPGDIVNDKSFKVLQVIGTNTALAKAKSESGFYWGILYLLVNKENKFYYDDEIINTPKNNVVRQIGVYRYTSKNGDLKTVPIVMFFDK